MLETDEMSAEVRKRDNDVSQAQWMLEQHRGNKVQRYASEKEMEDHRNALIEAERLARIRSPMTILSSLTALWRIVPLFPISARYPFRLSFCNDGICRRLRLFHPRLSHAAISFVFQVVPNPPVRCA